MTPRQAAARFAAFVWYTNNRNAPLPVTEVEARRFARESWESFLPVANEGLGRLLLAVARLPKDATAQTGGRRNRSTANRPGKQRLAAAI